MRPTSIRPLLSAALAIIALIPSSSVDACSCVQLGAPQEELAKPLVVAVFQGRALQSEPRDAVAGIVHTSFAVSRVWKGRRDPLHWVGSAAQGAACGRTFVTGEEYVVYEYEGGNVSLCSRTNRLQEAGADLAALGPGFAPEGASPHLLGRHSHLAGSWYNPARSGEGFVVEVLDDTRGAVYWFGFDPADPQRQAWMSGVGTFVGDVLRVDDLLRPVGGGFGAGFRADFVQRPRWGSLTLRLSPDGTGLAEFRQAGTDSNFSTPIQRLTRPPAPPAPAGSH